VLLCDTFGFIFDCCRTESVVEKLLTNWLSLCMYPYLKTHVNKSLFMLYKAIKHQTEKGPVDAVTAEARYSLSEDRLLREKTESRTLVSFPSLLTRFSLFSPSTLSISAQLLV